MKRLPAPAAAVFPITACASVEMVGDTQEEGIKRVVRQPYGAVYQEALNFATRRRLYVVEQDCALARATQ